MKKASKENSENKAKKATITKHLEELRRVIIISVLAIILGMVASYFFLMEQLTAIVFGPIRNLGRDLVMIGIAEGFWVQLKLACIGGIIMASPVILWKAMGFVFPALYKHERKIFLASFFISLFLFVAGIIFAYMFVFELGLRIFLLDFAQGLTPMISASKYMSFFINFLLPFGLVFQIPIAAYLLSSLSLITPDFLRKKRGYAVLAIFILAALLSPPDVLSQIMLALPMLLLYEVSILLAVLVNRKKKRKQRLTAEEV